MSRGTEVLPGRVQQGQLSSASETYSQFCLAGVLVPAGVDERWIDKQPSTSLTEREIQWHVFATDVLRVVEV